MEITSTCEGFFGSLFGHKFKARYSKKSKMNESITQLKRIPTDALNSFVDEEKTYEGDVCVRCGLVMKKG